jgi:hypothetical protein
MYNKKIVMPKDKSTVLTSVKVSPDQLETLKIECAKRKFSFTKLVNNAIDLYLKDEEFKRKIHGHKVS